MNFGTWATSIAISLLLVTCPYASQAGDNAAQEREQTTFHADIIARGNPTGVMLISGGLHRWSGLIDPEYGITATYKQLGATLGVNPAYAQATVYGEWKPALFAQLRLQYDLFGFFGANGSLLSFSTGGAKFGKKELNALSGHEETALGQRILLQPLLTAKVGPVIIRNTTDLGYYRFDGNGPYFYEAEYDTLLKDGDFLMNNKTAFLMEAVKGPDCGMLLAGPFYEVTHASAADITRQRIGGQIYWQPAKTAWIAGSSRIYGQVGLNLQDRNRDKEAFLSAGYGFDF